MGNFISYQSSSNHTTKVILSDGTVHEFDQPISVAELMLEHPQHVVVEYHHVLAKGKKMPTPIPLPADKKLDAEKVYLMLPMRRGGVTKLSQEEADRLFLSVNRLLRARSLFSITFLSGIVCGADKIGHGANVVHMDNGGLIGDVGERSKMDFFEEISEERPEFLSRQFSSKGWKPSLDTIKEKKVEKKVPHWLF